MAIPTTNWLQNRCRSVRAMEYNCTRYSHTLWWTKTIGSVTKYSIKVFFEWYNHGTIGLNVFLFVCRTSDYLTNASTFRQDNVNKFLSEIGAEYPQFNELQFEKYVKNLIDGEYIPAPHKVTSDHSPITSTFIKSWTVHELYQLIAKIIGHIPALNGKIALVTGASSGIGRAIAKTLAKSGIITVAVARRIEKLIELQNELKLQNVDNLVPMQVDITDKDEVFYSLRF